MKLLITTRADEGIKNWTDITHPIIKKYAENVGADFEIVFMKTKEVEQQQEDNVLCRHRQNGVT